MGAITGSAGGVFRDILINEIPLIFRKDIYAMACFSGGLVYWIGTELSLPALLTQTAAATVVFVTRVVCVHFKIGLPILTNDD